MKKWIAAVVVVVLVIAAAVWYKAGSAPAVAETPETTATPAPAATPAPTATPETAATSEPTPAATEPPSDTGEKYEVSPGVYSDGTVRTPSIEEWESMTEEEQNAWNEAYSKSLGGGDVTDISEEATQEAFDDLTDPNNPYIQDFLEYKASLNN